MKNKNVVYLICMNLLFVNNSWGENMLSVDDLKKEITESTKSTISPEESKRRLEDAKLLFKRGKSDAAIYMLQQLSKADPDNYEVLIELGRIAVGAKNWAYSIQVFRQASLMRPKDIEVRLILMDVYKAYQMPIQEIIVAKEIIALDPDQLIASSRLAELYQNQAMYEDEIDTRRVVKKLEPDNYNNLKRLAEVLYTDSQLWESAKVYEEIRKYHPKKVDDMRQLASIYAKLDERFREAEIYDHIDSVSGDSGAGKDRVINRIRKNSNIVNPFKAGAVYTNFSESTLNLDRYDVFTDYTYLFTRSSFDIGVETNYSHLNYRGKGVLAGQVNINSGSLLVKGSYRWKGDDYLLTGKVGALHDDVSGRFFRSNNPATTEEFPFLNEDPSFNSYGGTIPIGSFSFAARPWMKEIVYRLDYEHNLVDEIDARLSLLTQNKVSASVNYESNNMTELQLMIDNTFVSDGNYRFHIKGAGYYNLWASDGMYDYRGRRKSYTRDPSSFIKIGYEVDYFNDKRDATNDKYETFVKSEVRHEGILSGQALLFTFDSNHQVLFRANFSYGGGTTLDYRKRAQGEFVYFLPDSTNSISLGYTYEDEKSANTTSANGQIGGFTDMHQLALNLNWHF
ncbi:MAG: hypothetical protein KAH20_12030 [Methylococcales bacterium]|nr:hypothetical protein [Methylococcales bacterium]